MPLWSRLALPASGAMPGTVEAGAAADAAETCPAAAAPARAARAGAARAGAAATPATSASSARSGTSPARRAPGEATVRWVMGLRLQRAVGPRPPILAEARPGPKVSVAPLGDQRRGVVGRRREKMDRPAPGGDRIVAVPGDRSGTERPEHELERGHALREARAGRLDERLLAAPDAEEGCAARALVEDRAQGRALARVEEACGNIIALARADVLDVDADLASPRKRVEAEGPGMTHVEGERRAAQGRRAARVQRRLAMSAIGEPKRGCVPAGGAREDPAQMSPACHPAIPELRHEPERARLLARREGGAHARELVCRHVQGRAEEHHFALAGQDGLAGRNRRKRRTRRAFEVAHLSRRRGGGAKGPRRTACPTRPRLGRAGA